MRYQAVIFDLDGVICHTDEYHYMAWKKIADVLGIDYTPAINHRMRGVDRMASLDILLGETGRCFSKEQKERLAAEKNKIYRELLSNLSPDSVPRDVMETLQSLRNAGLKLAIGSSSKNTKYILEKLGLGNFFDGISDGTNVTHAKPDPEVFLHAAEMVGVPPDKCLVVEDARAGILAATAAGMDSVAVGEVGSNGLATYRLNQWSDLLPIIESEEQIKEKP
jgi:beta-phosphoglucomutase